MADSSVPARTWWHECKSAGRSCCQLLSEVERRGSAPPRYSPHSENQQSYSLLVCPNFIFLSSSSCCFLFFFLLLAVFHCLLCCFCLTQHLSLSVSSVFLHSFFFLFKTQPSPQTPSHDSSLISSTFLHESCISIGQSQVC